MFSSKDLFFTPAAGGFTVSKSLRFRKSASANLTRTFSTPTSGTTWTWSAWMKRGALDGVDQFFFSRYQDASNISYFRWNDTNILRFYDYSGGVLRTNRETNAVFRDPSAWYHVVLTYDSNNGTAANRARIYVNSIEQTYSASTNPNSGQTSIMNSSGSHQMGSYNSTSYFDGYMAEVNFVDGSALTPTSFGAYDTNGIWQPAAYTGSYGTNGFYLKFTDVGATSGSNTGYGKDFAGTNYWTTNNFGTTSTATTYDSMLDSPTNATGDIGNYATFNPLAVTSVAATFADGNLTLTTGLAGGNCYGTFAIPPSGKWYWEITVGSANNPMIGISAYLATQTYAWQNGNSVFYYFNGQKYVDGTASTYGASYTTNNVIGVAVDADAGTITFYKDNATQGAITHAVSGLFPCLADGGSGTTDTFYANFGQRPFAYTPPSGFSALNTQNLSTPTITNGAQYMAAVTYTGTGSSQTITASSTNSGNNPNGTTFQPDFVWIKSRSNAQDHKLTDVVRGTTKALISNTTGVETTDTNGLTAFTSSGFTIGSDATYNTNTYTYVAWEWKGGGTGVSNTSGSITSTVSANTSAGFSVVTGVSTGASGSISVGHGLGVTPSMVIFKNRDLADDWYTWHTSLGASTSGYNLKLDTTAAVATNANIWGGAGYGMTSTTIGLGQGNLFSASNQKFVCYAFAPIASYSSFGSYTGNGSSDGPFVYTGFRPRWIMWKRTDAAASWLVYDTSRSTYNVMGAELYPNLSDAEATTTRMDFLSNGFKLRAGNSADNASGGTYIYAAFAENPFKISRAR